MHDAIQKTESRVMGSWVSAPRLPDAWEKISCPVLLTATKTKPGILFESEVAESIAERMLVLNQGSQRITERITYFCESKLRSTRLLCELP